MLLNCKQCHKNVNEYCLQINVCQLSLLTFKMVLMTLMLASMKVHLSLLYPNDAYECPKMILNVD